MQVTVGRRNRQRAYSGVVAEPPDADLVLAFLNTVDVEEHTDVLDDHRLWRAWLAERRLTAGDLGRVRAARAALRGAVGDPDAAAAPDAADTTVTVRLGPGGPELTSVDVIGAVLAAAVRLAERGDWGRVKICPADDCRWAFYDLSRNRSRNWCSMRVCGNREKARAWRERTKAP